MINSHADFIAAGGNRHPAAADWDIESGTLAYGADCNVALWRPEDEDAQGVHTILRGHTGVVNAVRFFRSSVDTRSLLLSGSTDKTIRIWRQLEQEPTGWQEAALLEGHETPINAFSVLPHTSYFASASANPYVHIWQLERANDSLHSSLKQKILLSSHYFPLAIDLAALTESKAIILAVAGSSAKIQIYASSANNIDFKAAATLTGHEGWIRSLAFARENHLNDSDILLASASQDKYIRLWRLHRGEALPPVSQAAKDPSLGSISKTLSNKPHRFAVGESKFSVTFEALLVGHEDWIYTARWDTTKDHLRLLTASADNSLSIWELDHSSEVWICSVRLGEISAQKGATTATGSSGGFWTGLWSPSKDAVVSLGRTGAWRLWRHNTPDDVWSQHFAVTGHTRALKSLAWSNDGSYLLSTGADQTTRMFAEWKREDKTSWHELSRAQIHGYDLNCIDSIDKHGFVSGADEKLLRVFEEPKGVAELLSSVAGSRDDETVDLPETAQMPVMGLSNKAGDDAAAEVNGDIEEVLEETSTVSPKAATQPRPPVEDQLGRHLLWPEKEKLYGHGYEICAVAASHDGTLIATACRASSIDHAVIRVYETQSWQEIKPPLKAHSLTVTSLAFSSDDEYLLSVGRDRQCCVWTRSRADKYSYRLHALNSKAHSRMILDACWTPPSEHQTFITAGRDKRLHVWRVEDSGLKQILQVPFNHPVTAVACRQEIQRDGVVVATGCEDGAVFMVHLLMEQESQKGDSQQLPSNLTPSKAVTSLAWRPLHAHTKFTSQLAIASEDASLHIVSVPRFSQP